MGLEPLSKNELILYSIGVLVLIIFTGITAGLQVALFSIDRMFLRIVTKTGSLMERRRAEALLGVLRLEHWTLVALLVLNASAMATLPILIDHIFDPLTALLLSISAVVLLGDIIPLSVFVRWSLQICSFFVPLIWFAVAVTCPLSYPIGKLLDLLLGHRDELLQRDELAALLAVQKRDQMCMRESEVSMLKGALRLSRHRVEDYVVTRCRNAFMLSSRTPLDKKTVEEIVLRGYSRVPVYLNDNRRHILGVLVVRSMLNMCYTNPKDPPRAGEYLLLEVLRLSASTTLYNSYLAFQENRSNMAVVYDDRGGMIGIWTLTDLLSTLYGTTDTGEEDNRRETMMIDMMHGMRALSSTKRRIKPSLSDVTIDDSSYEVRSTA